VSSKLYNSDPEEKPEAVVPPQADKPRRVLAIHPLLFAAFPLLALYAQNVGQIPFHEVLRPLGMALLGTMAVWLLFLLFTRHVRKAALAASVVVLLFFSYGHIIDLLPQGLQHLVMPASGLALIALLFIILRVRKPLYDVTAVLNLVAVVLLIPSCWTIMRGLDSNARSLHEAKHSELDEFVPGIRSVATIDRHLSDAPKDVPDVYYIILDAYGRADRLRTYYGYDNTPFLDALRKRGFYLPSHSEPNYNQTPLCLSSALSMNYLVDRPGKRLSPEVVRQMVDDNAVAACLRKQGYHYVVVWSGLEVSRVTTADLVFNNSPDLSILESEWISRTPIGTLASHRKARYNRHRLRILGGFSGLEEAASLPYPKFVFTHILAPHPPFVFGANGEPHDPVGTLNLSDASDLLQLITKDDYRRGYIAQLQYVNKRTLEAIDMILRNSRHRPIIIVQGDHGSRMSLNWESLAQTDLREPFANLNAYYVPDKVRRDLWDTITPVNSFRVVLNDVFGEKYPRLPDRNFYSTESHPFDFIEVTDQLLRIEGTSDRVHSATGAGGQNDGKHRLMAR
jgi:hypothetical protein